MQKSLLKPNRNLSMECYKFFASFLVVLDHVRFPGIPGDLFSCLAQGTIYVFFAITGYFNWGASCKVITKRIKHILKVYITAVALYVFWCCIKTELFGGSSVAVMIQMIPDPDEAMRWLILQADPFIGSYWYFNSILVCYVIFWLYTKFFDGEKVDYKPWYIAAFCLFVINFLKGQIEPVAQSNVMSAYHMLRNAWFMGIPMFAFGMFVREYQERLVKNFGQPAGKLVAVVAGGLMLAFAQLYILGSFGVSFGLLIAIFALVILMAAYPRVPMRTKSAQWLIPRFGFYSTVIYITHAIYIEMYELFLQTPMMERWGAVESYLHSLTVLALSILSAVLAERGLACWGAIRRGGKKTT